MLDRESELSSKAPRLNSLSGSDAEDSDYSWINWFCDLEGHEFFCEIDEEFINDSFNLFGLRAVIPKYT